ncbi:condensin-2 complex subunit D3 [Achlya hypogyna]|uniref:Condensin-2 complex subunit D3 n=1 Tax=Achlya hypogyna TaxID=1202772 RepID=A0A1V9Z702_ACHHY|nr:condensin-2 complex subunit D3 [Achlya hypogyna]
MSTRASARAAVWTDLSRGLTALELWEVPEEILSDIYTLLVQGLPTPDAEEGFDYLRDVSFSALSGLREAFAAVLDATRENLELSQDFWRTLLTSLAQNRDDSEDAGSHRSLLVALHLIIAHALGMDKSVAGITATIEAMEIGLMAANVYLQWLQVPGGTAFGVFIPFLYRESLHMLHAWAMLMYSPESDASEAPRQLKRKQHQARRPLVQSVTFSSSGELLLDTLAATATRVALQHDAIAPTIDAIVSLVNFMLLQNVSTTVPRKILQNLCHHQARNAVLLVLGRLIPGVVLRENALPTGPWDKQQQVQLFHEWAVDTIELLLANLPADALPDVDNDDDTPATDEIVLCVLQQLCLRIPDKSDDRKKVGTAVLRLLQSDGLAPALLSPFLAFVDSYARHDKVKFRQFAVELVAELAMDERVFAAPVDDDTFMGLRPLLVMLGHRACDRVSVVRTKALAAIAALIAFGGSATDVDNRRGRFATVLASELRATTPVTPLAQAIAVTRPIAAQLLALCRDRLLDEKTFVRKAAIQALEALLLLRKEPDVLSDIHGRCADPSIIVRKQAMQTLTVLLTAAPADTDVQVTWNLGVLPLVLDPEASVQASCLGHIERILLDRILQWPKKHAADAFVAAVFAQLSHLDSFLIRFFQKAVRLLGRSGQIAVAQLVQHAIDGVRDRDARKWTISWVLLDELTASGQALASVSATDAKVVAQCWADSRPVDDDDNVLRILRVLCTVAPKKLPRAQASELAATLESALHDFAYPLNLIPVAIHGLQELALETSWRASLWAGCEAALDRTVPAWAAVDRALQTMGDLVLLDLDALDRPSRLPASHFQRLQRFVLPRLTPEAAETPSATRALAFVAVGKACLFDEHQAKECITMFMRELQTSRVEAIRSNLLLVLGDLCIRFTALVDVYVPSIAAALLDSSHLVRRNTLLLFSQLILQDYIKWKESLLHYFLRALVDPHDEMASLAQHILAGPLLLKTPTLFTMKFVEAVFVFNNVPTPNLTGVISTPMLQALSLAGNANFPKRLVIYRFLLAHMRDEHKLQVSMKLVTEVLEEVVEGKLQLAADPKDVRENSVEAVLQDALILLSSPEIKLSAQKDRDVEELEAEPSLQVAKRNLLSKMSRKNFLENVVPVMIALKHALQAKRSPVMRYLLHCIKELFTYYKTEVNDILAADPQMAKEVLYDLRQYEQTRRPSANPSTFTPRRASIGGFGGLSTKKAALMTPLTRIQREHRPAITEDEETAATLSESLSKSLIVSPNGASEPPRRQSQQWNVSVESPFVKQAPPSKSQEMTKQTLDFSDVSSDSSDDAFDSASRAAPSPVSATSYKGKGKGRLARPKKAKRS